MEEKHRLLIQKNYVELIHNVDLLVLLNKLIDKGVFSLRLAEQYRNQNKTEIDRKRDLFANIHRRGPNAFEKLVESLNEINDYQHKMLALRLEEKPLVIPSEIPVSNIAREIQTSGSNPFKLSDTQRPLHIRQISQENPYASINLAQDPLKIHVKKAVEYFDDQRISKIPLYRMRNKCRGTFLGINNIEFVNNVHNYRKGAQVDEENLKELFKQMNFDISCHRNQTIKDMRATIRRFADAASNPALKRADCLIVAVMSHGEEGETKESSCVVASDNQLLPVAWILEQFDNVNCPEFRHKPKIFIFQICRGKNLHIGLPTRSRVQSDGWNDSPGHLIRNMTDMLIAFATLPGDQSYRDIFQGTWYVQLICEIFMNHSFDTDVESLLKIVDERLQYICNEERNMQTSSYESRAFKKCFLHPGLFEEAPKK